MKMNDVLFSRLGKPVFRVVMGLVFASLAACSTPVEPLVVCHNSNCQEPPEPTEDDTLEALQASLAQQDANGVPLVDGIELDLFWFGDEDICLYAHDLSHGSEGPTAAEGIAGLIAALEEKQTTQARLTRQEGVAFQVFLELKGHVGLSKSEKHSDEQREAHASCALDMVALLQDAAQAHGWSMAITLNSFDPSLMTAVSQLAQLDEIRGRGILRVRLGAIFGVPPPLDSQTRPLSEWPDSIGIEAANVHPHWIRQGSLEVFKSRGWDVAFWMFSQVPETLAAIERHEPRWMVTNEANTIDRWLRR
ncbi:MAG: hypothetical protein GY822_31210 [Deltaproteobacteria bacterium]|nr:hypothetical protein [Deltaproteobacteria bacterium]